MAVGPSADSPAARRCAPRCRAIAQRLLLAGLGLLAAAALPAAAAAREVPSPAPRAPAVIDGPSADIVGMGASPLSIARDGTGGLVYLKNVGGAAHVFVSRLVGGSFQAPQQVDGTLPSPSSQPVIAAGNGGVLIVAFVNGGELYAVSWPSSGSPSRPPDPLASGASDPSISMSSFDKAYLAFTAVGDGGHDVRCAYYYRGSWGLAPSALDAAASDDAGTGTGRPDVVAANDGVGIVAWGEGGHVYTRRVWATSPSVADQQADPPSVGGASEVGADEPVLSAGGDSSYVDVAFRETLQGGAGQQTRVLTQRLHAGIYDGAVDADGLATPGPGGADQPQVAVGEYGQGFVTSARTDTDALMGLQLGNQGAPGAVVRIDSEQNTGLPYGVLAAAGYHSTLFAWQQNPGSSGAAEIHARFFDGSTLDPEMVLSTPAGGPTNAAAGIGTGADIAADGAVAWVQGASGGQEIVVDQLFQPPRGGSASARVRYVRTTRPAFSWSRPQELWGGLRYRLQLDGRPLLRTDATTAHLSRARAGRRSLSQGAHRYRITATNAAGQTGTVAWGTVFVDTVAPRVQVSLPAVAPAGSRIRPAVSATDAPAPLRRSQASGIASIEISFGDGTRLPLGRSRAHVYGRPGRYRVTVVATDRAGNRTRVVREIVIAGARRGR